MRRRCLGLLIAALAGCGSSTSPESGDPPAAPAAPRACEAPPAPDALQRFVGALHGHTGYSDGDIRSRPRDVFAQARARGLDYFGMSDHSDTLASGLFLSVGSDCLTPAGLLVCLLPEGVDELIKWPATGQQAEAATDERFLAIRGFEWTNDRYGHINVYFSRNFANAKADTGGFDTFAEWVARAPGETGRGGSPTAPVPRGGGGDGLMHFNHPSDKCWSPSDAACNWNDFAYRGELDARMFGIEVFNTGGGDSYWPDYVRALDAGWHLAPIGAEDEHGTDWAAPAQTKTVTLAPALTAEAFREAWRQRRVYALASGERPLRIDFTIDDRMQGSRLRCPAGARVPVTVDVRRWHGGAFDGVLELYSNGGEPLASVAGDRFRGHAVAPAAGEERWIFVRVLGADGQALAYSAPIWLAATPRAP